MLIFSNIFFKFLGHLLMQKSYWHFFQKVFHIFYADSKTGKNTHENINFGLIMKFKIPLTCDYINHDMFQSSKISKPSIEYNNFLI